MAGSSHLSLSPGFLLPDLRKHNSLLRLARERLLAGAPRRALSGAAMQQGLIQIVRDFCEHSNAICEDCKFPELVREWKESSELQDVRQEHEIK